MLQLNEEKGALQRHLASAEARASEAAAARELALEQLAAQSSSLKQAQEAVQRLSDSNNRHELRAHALEEERAALTAKIDKADALRHEHELRREREGRERAEEQRQLAAASEEHVRLRQEHAVCLAEASGLRARSELQMGQLKERLEASEARCAATEARLEATAAQCEGAHQERLASRCCLLTTLLAAHAYHSHAPLITHSPCSPWHHQERHAMQEQLASMSDERGRLLHEMRLVGDERRALQDLAVYVHASISALSRSGMQAPAGGAQLHPRDSALRDSTLDRGGSTGSAVPPQGVFSASGAHHYTPREPPMPSMVPPMSPRETATAPLATPRPPSAMVGGTQPRPASSSHASGGLEFGSVGPVSAEERGSLGLG